MPEWVAVLLGIAAAVIALLFVVVGWLVADKLESIKSGMAELGEKFDATMKSLSRYVTWDEFNKLKTDVTSHSTDIAVIKTTCAGRHRNP